MKEGTVTLNNVEKVIRDFFEVADDEQIKATTKEETFNAILKDFIESTIKRNDKYKEQNIEVEISDIEQSDTNEKYEIKVGNILSMKIGYDNFLSNKNTIEKVEDTYEFFSTLNSEILKGYKEDNYKDFIPTTKEDELIAYSNYAKDKILNQKNNIEIDSKEEGTLLTIAQVTRVLTKLEKSNKYPEEVINTSRENLLQKAKGDIQKIYEEQQEVLKKEEPVAEIEVDYNGNPKTIKVSNLDEIVASNPNILEVYKSLKNSYNLDGSKMDIDEKIKIWNDLKEDVENNNRLEEKNKEMIIDNLNSYFSLELEKDIVETVSQNGGIRNLDEARMILGDEVFASAIDTMEKTNRARVDLQNQNTNEAIKYFNNKQDDVFFELSDSATNDLINIIEIVEKRRTEERVKQLENEETEKIRKEIIEKVRKELEENKKEPLDEEKKNEIIEEREEKRKPLLKKIKERAAQKDKEEPEEIYYEPQVKESKPYTVKEPIEDKKVERKENNKNIEDDEKNERENNKSKENREDDGYNGRNGIDGENGKTGKNGDNGIDGENGKDGKDGNNGIDGKSSTKGKEEKDIKETSQKLDETNKEIDSLKQKIDDLNNTISELNSKPDLNTNILIDLEQLKSMYKQLLEKENNGENEKIQSMIEELQNKIDLLGNNKEELDENQLENNEKIIDDENNVIEGENVSQELNNNEEQEKSENSKEELDENIVKEESNLIEDEIVSQGLDNNESQEKINEEEQLENNIKYEDNVIIDNENEQVVEEKDDELEVPNEQNIEENVQTNIQEGNININEQEENNEEKTPKDLQREVIDALISNLEQRNQKELEKYEEELNMKADEIIESLDPNKYSLQQLYDARDHLNKKIEEDVSTRKETLNGYIEFIKESMNEQVSRQEKIQEINTQLEEKKELMQKIKDKKALIHSIENDTLKSLEAVEAERDKLQQEKNKLENEKGEGTIGKH